MINIGKPSLNKNTLHIKYDGVLPYFEIQTDPHLFSNFQTDHHLEILASNLEDSSLKITIRLKNFRVTINFNAIIALWENHHLSIRNFLSSLASLDKIDVVVVSSTPLDIDYRKSIKIPDKVKESSKYFSGDFSIFQPNDGLEETFELLPVGFLVPFSTPSYFLLLCKMEDTLFDKIKFAPYHQIEFKAVTKFEDIVLSISFCGVPFASLRIEKSDICDDILDDINILIDKKTIHFAFTTSTMKAKMYLNFSKSVEESTIESISSFFYDNKIAKKQTSL